MPLLSSSLLSKRQTSPLTVALRVALLALLGLAYRRWLQLRRAAPRKVKGVVRDIMKPVLDTRRQVAIAKGQAIDHAGACVEIEDPDFDLQSTIFAIVARQGNFFVKEILRKQLARVPHWSDEALDAFRAAAASAVRPAPPIVDKRITDFMLNECNFKMEHADGSFMDHVAFCHDYCAIHYKAQSPRVLLLHSILGVGTNIFPMEAAKIPQLAELISESEMKQVEAFPSLLRLLVAGQLISELRSCLGNIHKLKRVSFSRVLDNKALELDAEEFWVQLNYQVVHLIDFLPTAEWQSRVSEPLFQVFLELRSFLTAAGQLQATVDLGATCGDAPEECDLLGAAATSGMSLLKRALAKKNIKKFSAEISHSLEYALHWSD